MRRKPGQKDRNTVLTVCGIFLISLSVILIICFFLQGKRQTSNSSGVIISSDNSLICNQNNYLYPFLEFDNSDRKEAKIYAVFNESGNALRTISYRQTLYYSNETLVRRSEAYNHAAMNLSFAANKMENGALGLNFSLQDDKLIMSLYATGESLDSSNKKYFLINKDDTTDILSMEKHYLKLGFNCNKQENNN